MEITDRIDRNRVATILIGIASFAAGALFIQYLRSSPQIGHDEKVYKTVDALFTALTSRDNQRLSDCEQRLQSYLEAGELSAGAATNLERIISRARAGEWEASARKLYSLIMAQRRLD